MAARPNARVQRATKPYPLVRPNAQERAGDVGNCSGLCFVGLAVGLSMQSNLRTMQPIGHSTIKLGLHLHAEIGLSNVSDIHYAHPLNTACIEIQCVADN